MDALRHQHDLAVARLVVAVEQVVSDHDHGRPDWLRTESLERLRSALMCERLAASVLAAETEKRAAQWLDCEPGREA